MALLYNEAVLRALPTVLLAALLFAEPIGPLRLALRPDTIFGPHGGPSVLTEVPLPDGAAIIVCTELQRGWSVEEWVDRHQLAVQHTEEASRVWWERE